MIQVTEHDGESVTKQVDYAYDAFNRLVKRTVDGDGSGGSASQYWAYDEGINAVVEFDGSSASDLSHRYLWSDRVDELLADEQVTSLSAPGDTLYALSDHLGTIRDIANFNESTSVTSVTNHRTYNSFGKLISETNAAVDLIFGFTGKQFDDATGLQHNLFRWYDSELGQWLSEDPLGFAAGDENVRRYVGSKPIFRIDPTGLHDPNTSSTQVEIYLFISGFGDFSGLPIDPTTRQRIENPSTPTAEDLGMHLTQIGVSNTVVSNLGVDWDVANKEMTRRITEYRQENPEAQVVWISLGAGEMKYEFEVEARNKRRVLADFQGRVPGQKGVSLYNVDGGERKYVNTEASRLIARMKAAGANIVASDDAGSYLCESLAYYIAYAKTKGLIGSGFFMHVPNLKYNTATENMTVRAMAVGLASYYGPDADPDGDGLPNRSDPEPFRFTFLGNAGR